MIQPGKLFEYESLNYINLPILNLGCRAICFAKPFGNYTALNFETDLNVYE
jgi:hypothetical protein